MSKLIVEMEMPINCKKCPLVRMDHFGQIRCEGQGDRLIHLKNFQTEIERPSWCPIAGVLPDEPTVDAVPVVRCKECIHRPKMPDNYVDGFDLEFPDHKCPCQCEDGFYSWYPADDWFCADGERRTDGEADNL